MAKIYISGTFQDLREERARAYAQLRRSRHDVISMEDYNAARARPLAKCLSDVAQADIYVGLIAWRYGYVPDEPGNPDGRSITELEYRHALQHCGEVLLFHAHDDWPSSKTDMFTGESEAGAHIRALRDTMAEAHIVSTFTDAENLAALLSPAVEEANNRLFPVSAEQLDEIATLSLEQLQNLAARFGIEDCYDLPAETLRQQLTFKADEYRALKAEVDNIGETYARLSNLKAAAQDAIARMDLAEVEELLSRVQEVEKEEAAKTGELRAENAILRGKLEQAYELYSDAADGFRIFDPVEPARRRHEYMQRLYFHGLRYGGNGMALAERMIGDALQACPRERDAMVWAMCKNAQALSLQNQGIRIEGSAGTELLRDAVTAYRAALEVCTRADHPANWAMAQNNLGNTLQEQGIRSEGAAGAELLAEAVTAYRAALEVLTRADHPVDWAMTQNNLGAALQAQGIRTDGPAGADLLREAVTAYRAALEIHTRADHPVDWAMTQNNLGNALSQQGIRTEGAAGANLLREAVTAYRNALKVCTRADHPVQWAETKENMALAEEAIADHGSTKDPSPRLAVALTNVEDALTVYDPEHMSYQHATATRLRDRIQAKLDALDDP